jgi:hypothetical protein
MILVRPSEAELAAMTSSEIHALGENGKPRRPQNAYSYKKQEGKRLEGDALAWLDPVVNAALIAAIKRESATSPKTTRHAIDCQVHKACRLKRKPLGNPPAPMRPKGCAHEFGRPCARYRANGTIDTKPCVRKFPPLPSYQPKAWHGDSLENAVYYASPDDRQGSIFARDLLAVDARVIKEAA